MSTSTNKNIDPEASLYHDRLDVDINADPQEVRKSSKIAKSQYHPDNNESVTREEWNRIQKAEQTLRDSALRAEYKKFYHHIDDPRRVSSTYENWVQKGRPLDIPKFVDQIIDQSDVDSNSPDVDGDDSDCFDPVELPVDIPEEMADLLDGHLVTAKTQSHHLELNPRTNRLYIRALFDVDVYLDLDRAMCIAEHGGDSTVRGLDFVWNSDNSFIIQSKDNRIELFQGRELTESDRTGENEDAGDAADSENDHGLNDQAAPSEDSGDSDPPPLHNHGDHELNPQERVYPSSIDLDMVVSNPPAGFYSTDSFGSVEFEIETPRRSEYCERQYTVCRILVNTFWSGAYSFYIDLIDESVYLSDGSLGGEEFIKALHIEWVEDKINDGDWMIKIGYEGHSVRVVPGGVSELNTPSEDHTGEDDQSDQEGQAKPTTFDDVSGDVGFDGQNDSDDSIISILSIGQKLSDLVLESDE